MHVSCGWVVHSSLAAPSRLLNLPFLPPARAYIHSRSWLRTGFVKSSPCQAYLYLSYNPIPHHIPPRCNSPLIRAPPHPDIDANLEFKADPEPHSLIYLSIPIPILCYLYLFIIFLSPFANRHHHCSCKTHRPVSHPTSVFTTPRTHTKYKQVKSLYPHYLLAPSDPHFHFLLDRKTSPPDPCAPLLSISTWKTTVNPLDTSPSFVTFFCPFCAVLWFLTDYTSVFLRRTLPLPLRLAHALAPTSRLTSSLAHRARPPFAFNSIVLRYTFVPLFSNLSSFFVLSISISLSLCFSRPVSCVPVPLAAVVPLMHS